MYLIFFITWHNQPGGGDGEKLAGFRMGFWFANYRGPHLTRKRSAMRNQIKEKKVSDLPFIISQKGKSLKQTCCLSSSLHLKRMHNILTGTTAENIKGGMDEAFRNLDDLWCTIIWLCYHANAQT
jgi:hypothetical protein